jgi:hypothetical protein
MFFYKTWIISYALVSSLIEYFMLYIEKRYLEIFIEYDRLIETQDMKKKIRYSKIIIWATFATDIIWLCIADYVNH